MSFALRSLPAAIALALAGAASILLLQSIPAVLPALEYRRVLLAAEPWRLLGAHLVHVNWLHAAVNAGAWLLLARLFLRELGFGLQLLCLAIAAVFISLALAAWYPGIAWYRGASGVLHALYFAGAMAMLAEGVGRAAARRALLAPALLAGGWIKVAMEMPRGADTVFSDWLGAATVPQAHFLGAVCGTALGLAAGLGRRGRGVRVCE
jgi:rhomboid family GlyGly-CTERM serine protease